MSNSRTKKSIVNLTITIITQILNLLIKFIGRTLFIHYLGVELLGINGLFTNILTLLSLAELGFGNAVIYSMYKPLKNNDQKKLAGLINFYKKIYRYIMLIILIAGICFVPFLNSIINLKVEVPYIKIYYLLFLLDTVFSYAFVYKQSIINADQKMYILKIVYFFSQIIQFVMQTVILIFFKNFVAYLIIQVLCTLFNNVTCSLIANKKYSYINDRRISITPDEKKSIFSNVKSLFLYKISGTVLNNTDNIYISLLIGTEIVGVYSNYYMIINSLNGILYLIFNSVTASVGNLMTEKDNDKKNKIFLELNFLCFFLTGAVSIILYGVFNDFITLWVGNEYVLSNAIIYITIINLYIYDMQIPVWIYRDTTGLFNDAKNATIVVAILNIILSYILGIKFGLFGILIATALSRLLVTTWQQPLILYKKVLKSSSKEFFIKKIEYLLFIFLILIPIFFIKKNLTIVSYPFLIIKIILIGMIYLFFFIIAFGRTKEFNDLKEKLLIPFFKKITNKKSNKFVTKS